MSRFNEFWNAYNYKIGRKNCERIWKRDRLDSIADQIIASIPAYDAYLKANSWLNKKHPSTFLNGAHWEDEYPTPEPPKPDGPQRFSDIARMQAHGSA